MDEAQLEKYLRMIGKECFVTFFARLSDFSQTDQVVAEFIAGKLSLTYRRVVTSQNALTWRVKPARTIIRAGQSREAMLLISRSSRLPSHVTQAAANIARALGVDE